MMRPKMRPDLAAFIEHARDKGLDPMTIRMLLLSAGWKEKDVAQALSAQALELPIPAPPDTGGAREAFLHLLAFAAFYTAAIAAIVLSFTYIELALPDPAEQAPAHAVVMTGVRRSLAALIVGFPLFLWLSRFLLREMRDQRERAWSPVRRWLTYLTLFVAATTLMCDVIALVFRLLEGELSLRFLAKVVIVGGIAGGTFGYYLQALRLPAERAASARLHRGFAVAASVVAIAAVGWGVALAGSPGNARLRAFDERRLGDLQAIDGEIRRIAVERDGDRRPHLARPLPETLDAVVAAAEWQRPDVRDPETGEPYGYEIVDGARYRLCATFRFARDERFNPLWNHEAGRHCFELDALDDGSGPLRVAPPS